MYATTLLYSFHEIKSLFGQDCAEAFDFIYTVVAVFTRDMMIKTGLI